MTQYGLEAPGHAVKKAKPTVRRTKEPNKRARIAGIIAAVVVLAACAAGVVYLYNESQYIEVTLNGQQERISASSTIDSVIEEGLASPKAGNLLAIDGSVIEEGGGTPFTAYINDQEAPDGSTALTQGCSVSISDGVDVTESYTESYTDIDYGVTFDGSGAIHRYMGGGEVGKADRKTGDVSGITQDETLQDPVNATVKFYNAHPEEKLVALTFDDGPWPETTAEILDILAENDAKATFFTIGDQITGDKVDLVKRAHDEGHQICTHSYDHASGSGQGVNLGFMSAEEQTQEIQKGYDAIKNAIGEEASRIIRTPGGNFNEKTARILEPLVDAEIGWNIDTEDWRRPGADAIASRIESAENGSIILMHDGDGDRSQTVKALREALPRLKEQGFRFVTIDELLAASGDPASE